MGSSAQQTQLRRLARVQHGVIGLDQARAAGLSEDTIRRRVATKAWRRAGVRVFQVGEHEETPASRTVAAMLSLGAGATLVGRSAAWWWDLHDVAPARVEVAVPGQVRPRSGITLARRAIDPVDRTLHRRLAITCRAPTVLDAAVRLGLEDGARLMDRALGRRAVGLDALREVHSRTAGRHGAPLAGRLLQLAGGGARFEAERTVHRLFRAAGITGWSANAEIVLPGFGRAVGDVVLDAERVVLEVDGWAYHRGLRAFLIDGPRQSELVATGWVVMRTHWYEVTQDPDTFVRRVCRTLASRSSSR